MHMKLFNKTSFINDKISLLKNKKMKKLLIFGGTFDPIHNGHIKMLLGAITKIQPDLSLIIPTKNPPLKDSIPTASSKDRVAMINLAIKSIPKVKVCDYEIKSSSNAKSYTYLTIKYLKNIYKNYQFYFLVGMDRLNDFDQWKNYKQILNNVTLVVAGRNNQKPKFDNAIKLTIDETNISSKQLREKPNKKFLNLNVVKYIANNGVYAQTQIKSLMSDYRYQHTLRVAKTALEICSIKNKNLAKKAYLAAMYHDVAKEFNRDQILEIIGNKFNRNRFPTAHTLHGCASAVYVKQHFYVTDKEVLDAIYNHVIPPKKPSILSKIIYCADKLEPARTNKDMPNRAKLLLLAKTDLNKAYDQVLAYNKSRFN